MSKTVFVTGGAGFIGFHTALALHRRGDRVICLDNFNDYYDPLLKEKRAAQLEAVGIKMIRGDITDKKLLAELFSTHEVTHCLHLAAQAGVRYARKHPEVYLKSNLEGFLAVLEQLKNDPSIPLIYASSSSVYGTNQKVPFSTTDPTDQPANLYAATKKANEVMASAYHHMYGLKTTGLRYFTVYGPWGRPDMAYFSFTKAIIEGKPITLFNRGEMWRDFTYIDDIVEGTLAAIDLEAEHQVFNLGNRKTESLTTFVHLLEQAIGKKAVIELADCPCDEMLTTYADIEPSVKYLNFQPKTSLEKGLTAFVTWFKKSSI